MRYKLIAAGSLIVAAAVFALHAAAGPAAAARKVSCTYRTTVLIEPGSTAINPTATKGHLFAFVTCGRPFGAGVHVESFTVMMTSSRTATLTGPYKEFFDTGTIHGTFRFTGEAISATKFTYTGTATIQGGTAAFRHVAGNVKLRCSSTGGDIHALCTGKVTLT